MASHEDDFNLANDIDNRWDTGLDVYQSADDIKFESNGEAGDGVMVVFNRYEQKSGGSVFSTDGKKIVLKPSL